MTFSDRLYILRTENGKSHLTLSDATGINVCSLWKYENGLSQPTLPNLMKLADYFKVSLDYLCCREDKELENISEMALKYAKIKEIVGVMK